MANRYNRMLDLFIQALENVQELPHLLQHLINPAKMSYPSSGIPYYRSEINNRDKVVGHLYIHFYDDKCVFTVAAYEGGLIKLRLKRTFHHDRPIRYAQI